MTRRRQRRIGRDGGDTTPPRPGAPKKPLIPTSWRVYVQRDGEESSVGWSQRVHR